MSPDIALLFWIPFGLIEIAVAYDGFSGGCYKPYRSGKSSKLQLPCEFKNQNWCILPGSSYPWHAVRRFVFENHGLMKRMYGEQRHISVLRAEIETNDLHEDDDFHDNMWHGHRPSAFKRYHEKPATPTQLKPPPSTTTEATGTSTAAATTTTITTTTQNVSTAASIVTVDETSTISTKGEDFTTTISNVSSHEDEDDDDSDEDNEDDEEGNEEPDTNDDARMASSTHTPSSTTARMSTTTMTTTFSTANYNSTTADTPEIIQPATTEIPRYRFKGINACPVKEEVVAPFWANNTRGEILALLNLYPFEQYVHWERCSHEHKQMYCRDGCRCEQQYRLYRLLAYDPEDDCRGIFSDWFKFPSCCVCKCYDIPADLKITSRSPRNRISVPPSWYT